MLNIKSIAETLAVVGSAALLVVALGACGGSQSPSPATDASGQPEDDTSSMSGSSSHKHDSKDSPDTSVGDVRVSSAFDANGEPIPGADGDISPDAKRPTPPPPSASASAAPSAAPPKKGVPPKPGKN